MAATMIAATLRGRLPGPEERDQERRPEQVELLLDRQRPEQPEVGHAGQRAEDQLPVRDVEDGRADRGPLLEEGQVGDPRVEGVGREHHVERRQQAQGPSGVERPEAQGPGGRPPR